MTTAEDDSVLALAGADTAVHAQTVFFASDPAGQRACLALATRLRDENPGLAPRTFCNRSTDVAADFEVSATRLERAPSEKELAGAAVVFCGTSHPTSSSRFELRALSLAGRAGLPSIAFVDHWTNFRLRFEAEDGRLVLPDQIWVLDARAMALAEADGLPRARLRISGSPTLAFLAHRWRARRTPEAVRAAVLPDQANGPVLLYAPDPLSLRPSVLEFDELSAAGALARAVAEVTPRATVLLRLHPLEPPHQSAAIAAAFAEQGVLAVHPDPGPTGWELCSAADVVVGFHSNFLLEARALGRPVLRYLPGAADADPLRHLTVGLRVTEKGALAAALATSLAARTGAR